MYMKQAISCRTRSQTARSYVRTGLVSLITLLRLCLFGHTKFMMADKDMLNVRPSLCKSTNGCPDLCCNKTSLRHDESPNIELLHYFSHGGPE